MSDGFADALAVSVSIGQENVDWNRTVSETSVKDEYLVYTKEGKCTIYYGSLPLEVTTQEVEAYSEQVEEPAKEILVEGVKYDADKPGMSLLPSKPLQEIARVLDYGARKYAPHNWRKGINYSRVYSAAVRHLTQWNEGQDTDTETSINHLAHAACNLLFLLEYQLSNKTAFDDRYKG